MIVSVGMEIRNCRRRVISDRLYRRHCHILPSFPQDVWYEKDGERTVTWNSEMWVGVTFGWESRETGTEKVCVFVGTWGRSAGVGKQENTRAVHVLSKFLVRVGVSQIKVPMEDREGTLLGKWALRKKGMWALTSVSVGYSNHGVSFHLRTKDKSSKFRTATYNMRVCQASCHMHLDCLWHQCIGLIASCHGYIADP